MTGGKFPEYLHKDSPFTVPDGYFDDFQKRIMLRIRETEKPVIRLNRYLKYAVAAGILLLSLTILLLHDRPPGAPLDDQSTDAALTWAYHLDKTAWMAAMLDMDETDRPEYYCCTEEQETDIIYFLVSQDIPIETLMQSLQDE
ncbi:MAG: hypothetical protein LBF89_02085 [Bacteroidales bacterium]|nr:hypothetical protein [Bacteroidales bacterium]